MADPLEVELKYGVRDRRALDSTLGVDRLGGLVVGPWRTSLVLDRHLDTSDGAVRRHGFAARLRRIGDVTMISLKGAAVVGSGGALHRRVEIEGPASEALDPTSWPASAARDRLLEMVAGAPLQVRFTLRQTRHERELKGTAGWALLSLDDVIVEAEGQRLGGFEVLEIESKGGSETILEPVARELAASGALTPEPRTKAALADDLLRQAGLAEERSSSATPPSPVPPTPGAVVDAGSGSNEPRSDPIDRQAEPGPELGSATVAPATTPPRRQANRTPGIRADDPLAEAGRKALRFQLGRLLDRDAELRSGDDPEAVHQARVATRRLRAIWRVFGDAYPRRTRRRYVRELRRVARRLGEVRDLDVLLAGLETYAIGLRPTERDAIGTLDGVWQARRVAAQATLVATLDGSAFHRFVDDLGAFVGNEATAGPPGSATKPTRVRETAASRIWLAYETLRAYDGTLRWADLNTLHAMRIAAKRLRYSLEAFREVLGPEATRLIERVVVLQDSLGALHDADVAASLARGFLAARAAGLPAPVIEAVGRYLTSREREVARRRHSLPTAWRPIVATTFRRDLGRAVSSL